MAQNDNDPYAQFAQPAQDESDPYARFNPNATTTTSPVGITRPTPQNAQGQPSGQMPPTELGQGEQLVKDGVINKANFATKHIINSRQDADNMFAKGQLPAGAEFYVNENGVYTRGTSDGKKITFDSPPPNMTPEQTTGAIGQGVQQAVSAAAVPLAPNLRPQTLQQPNAMGIGQAAIQVPTLGYGMPYLRNKIASSEQIRPPTSGESLVGTGLGMAATLGASGIYDKAMQVAGRGAPALAALYGAVQNPSDTKISPITDPRRLVGASLGALAQGAGYIGQKVSDFVKPESAKSFMRALKIGNMTEQQINDAAPEIARAAKSGVSNMEDFAEAASIAVKNVLSKAKGLVEKANKVAGETGKSTALSGQEIYNNMINSVDKVRTELSPEFHSEMDRLGKKLFGVEKIAQVPTGAMKKSSILDESGNPLKTNIPETETKKSVGFKNDITLEGALDKLQIMNTDLKNFFRSTYSGKYHANNQAVLAAKLQAREELKKAAYKKIDELAGPGMDVIKKRLGNLIEMRDAAFKQINIGNKKAPWTLQEEGNKIYGGAKMIAGAAMSNPYVMLDGVAHFVGSSIAAATKNPDKLIANAVNKIGKVAPQYEKAAQQSAVVATHPLDTMLGGDTNE